MCHILEHFVWKKKITNPNVKASFPNNFNPFPKRWILMPLGSNPSLELMQSFLFNDAQQGASLKI